MIINKITIENFQCYFEVNQMAFGPHLNIIIGENGKGKSKLFNAFYWTLFGKIFIREYGWVDTNELEQHHPKSGMLPQGFINDRALSLTPDQDSVKCSVTIELTNNESGRDVEYIIERSVVAKRRYADSWNVLQDWSITRSELKVTFNSRTGDVVEKDRFAELIVDKLFPEGIRNYIWFQGEALNSLLDFRKTETLKAAVKHISYYPMYEKISNIISLATKKIENSERKKIKEINKNNSEITTLIEVIEKSKIKLESLISEKDELDMLILRLRTELSKDEKRITGLAGYLDIVKQYEEKSAKIEAITKDISFWDGCQRKELRNSWIMKGIAPLIEDSQKIILEHTNIQDTVPERKFLENPSRSMLQDILDQEVCFVCGQSVCQNSAAYDVVLDRMKKQEEYLREAEDFMNNLSDIKKFERFIGGIVEYPDDIRIAVNSIDKNYNDSENRIEKLMSERQSQSKRMEKLDEQMTDIKNKYNINIKEAGNANHISTRLAATRGNIASLEKKLKTKEDEIKIISQKVKQSEAEFNKFNKSGKSENVPETEWKEVSSFLSKICSKIQERARKELLEKIQERANKFYAEFTKHSNSLRGSITINDDYSIGLDGGVNTGHDDFKKISIINALLSLNQEALGAYYPFISDAPTSSFDTKFAQSYLMGVRDMFGQTIIMTKDIVVDSEKYNELRFDEKVSRVYILDSNVLSKTSEIPASHEVITSITCKK